jgi:hypothetical protein
LCRRDVATDVSRTSQLHCAAAGLHGDALPNHISRNCVDCQTLSRQWHGASESSSYELVSGSKGMSKSSRMYVLWTISPNSTMAQCVNASGKDFNSRIAVCAGCRGGSAIDRALWLPLQLVCI